MSETKVRARPKNNQPLRSTSRSKQVRETIAGWGLLSPTVIILAVMVGFPAFTMVWQSFSDYTVKNKVTGEPSNFVGLQNYRDLFSYSDFPAVLIRSLVLMVIMTALILAVGMLIALMMQRLSRGWRLLVSVGLLLAWAMPALTATVLWGWIFDTEYGLVNWALLKMTGDEQWINHSWLLNPFSFFSVLILVVVWQSIPFAAFTFYAGLEQIPSEVIEAAQIDGASNWQRFRLIVMPYMRNIVTGVLVLEVIWTLRIFTQTYALQQRGGIPSETNTLGTFMFRQGPGQFAMTAAIGMVMVVILVILSVPNVRRTLKEEEL